VERRIVNEREVLDLLTIAATFDRRKVGEGDVHAWTDSARRGRWTFDEASEAIKNYYARTTSERPFIMPSHITNMVRAEREYESMRYRQESARPINPRVAKAVEQVAASTVIPDEPAEHQPFRNNALAVPCPHCHAGIGETCSRPRLKGRAVPMLPHPSRKELALDMNKGGVL
jgi:hypothetical protein